VANSVFFEAHPGIVQHAPDRTVARHHAPFAQLHHQRPQRQVGRRRKASQQPFPLRRQ
jgi:hypothetical protein